MIWRRFFPLYTWCWHRLYWRGREHVADDYTLREREHVADGTFCLIGFRGKEHIAVCLTGFRCLEHIADGTFRFRSRADGAIGFRGREHITDGTFCLIGW